MHVPPSALREGQPAGKQSTCRSISQGQGNTLNLEDTQVLGQQEESEHSLGRTLPMAIFPKTAQHRKHFF